MERRSPVEAVRLAADRAARHLLSQQDRNAYSPTFGCFDRRYWAWKLVDFPDATLQRAVHGLALVYADPASSWHHSPAVEEAVCAGVAYAASIQGPDGSFDQAFPHEHSFGATAFVLHSLLGALSALARLVSPVAGQTHAAALRRAANFLCVNDERHAFIANHLAGAAAALFSAAEVLQEARYARRAEQLLARVLAAQSVEGWFQEYDGADPGYQTLCLYYLAEIRATRASPELQTALERGVDFIAHFVHPDGTYAGDYGARRTAVYYPGGVAMVARSYEPARAVASAMWRSVTAGRTTTLDDVDDGNLSPLLVNYVRAVQDWVDAPVRPEGRLPCEAPQLARDFPEAGLYVRGTPSWYAVFGASTGGVLKVFDKTTGRAVVDDGGYVAELAAGGLVTTQMTRTATVTAASPDSVSIRAPFYRIPTARPTPVRFLLLRVLNLTLMRSVALSNVVKRLLVRALVTPKRRVGLELERRIRVNGDGFVVDDRLRADARTHVVRLQYGRSFSGIHMASAGYWQGAAGDGLYQARGLDPGALVRGGTLEHRSWVVGGG